jgi:endonuclease III-like uncharacterized protein
MSPDHTATQNWIEMSGIGLLNEKQLHASLKQWYARPGDQFEVAVGRFVIDIVRGDLFIEIQTGNFASVKSKLTNLADSHQVRLIYPIASISRKRIRDFVKLSGYRWGHE